MKHRAFPGITFRVMDHFQDFGQCVELQKETWGRDWTDVIPPSMLKVSQKVGGIVAGAFDGDRLLGFVFGLTGIRDGKPAHWSHQLAVTPDQRNGGLGRRLKLYQRDLLLSRGVKVMYWTFDPLVARNAHLNLNKLGARIHEYVPDFYKGETSSELHSGVGTDRFVVRWLLDDARTKRALAGKAVADYGCGPTNAMLRGVVPRKLMHYPAGTARDGRGTDWDLFRTAGRSEYSGYILGAGIEIPIPIPMLTRTSRHCEVLCTTE